MNHVISMKAAVYYKYGSADNIRIADVAKPIPKGDEALVKIYSASINAADWRVLRGKPFIARLAKGLIKPKNPVPGTDMAGVIEALGSSATRLKPGDRVYGCLVSCGGSAFGEYACGKESALATIPHDLTFDEAAALPMAAVTALQGLRDHGRLKSGQKVLINGASGGVGPFAVQIAKALGAEVTAKAMRHAETGHPRGKVIINIAS